MLFSFLYSHILTIIFIVFIMMHIKRFGLTNLIALIVLVVVASVVPTMTFISKNESSIKENFFGKTAEFNGVFEIWNIDSFEGGLASKVSYLESVGVSFQNLNKGLFVHVTNMSVEGLLLALSEGKKPDLFSFGSGIYEYIKDYVVSFEGKSNIIEAYNSSGKINNLQMAVAYATGGYCFISSEKKLALAGKTSEINIKDSLFDCGYTKKYKKYNLEVPSVLIPKNTCVSALGAVYYSTNQKSVASEKSSYDCYVDFIKDDGGTILVGNHRDLAILENKLLLGQIESLIVEPCQKYNDLVQYFAICKGEEKRQNCAKEFIEFTLESDQQKKLCDIGLFGVTKEKIYSSNELWSKMEDCTKNVEIVPNCSENISERENRCLVYTK